MEYCIGVSGFVSKGLSEYVQIAKRNGLRKIEVFFGMNSDVSTQLYQGMTNKELMKVNELFKFSGVCPYAFVVPNDFTSPNWKEHLDMVISSVDTAITLGCSIIVLYGGTFPTFDRSKDDWNYRRMPAISPELFKQSTDCFKRLIKYVGERHVKFAVENHDNMTFSGEHFVQFLNAVNSKKLGVAFDSTNFRCLGENPFRAFEFLKDKIFHVHLKGAHRIEDRVVFDHFMDKDDFNWVKMIKLFKDSYKGAYVLESLFPEIAEESIIRSMKYFNTIEENI